MAEINIDFNRVDVNKAKRGSGTYSLVSPGRHLFVIDEGDVKENSKRTGMVFNMKIKYAGDDPEFKDVFFYSSINTEHEKQKVRDEGQAQLLELILAQGQDPSSITNTDYLVGPPFYADVDVKPNTYRGETKDQNVVVRFVYDGNQHETPPGEDVPEGKEAPKAANDNTKSANDNVRQANPSTARSTQNGGSTASAASGAKKMPWQK